MLFSMRSSSFCFFACLLSSGFVCAQEPMHRKNVKFPIYDQGDSFYLTSNWKIKQIDGYSFPTAFMGAPGAFTLNGNNKSLSFIQCAAPLNGSLVSSTQSLKFTNLSSLLFLENRSQSSAGLIHSPIITIEGCRSVVFSQNATSYPHLITTNGGSGSSTTTVNNFHGSVLHAQTSVDISNIKKTLTFTGNTALFGPAILCDDNGTCSIHNNSATILFSSNHSTAAGGAIYNGSLELRDNSGPISFIGNTTLDNLTTVNPTSPSSITLPIGSGSGGAICVGDGSVAVSGNSSPITFISNSATNNAGAIYAKTFSLHATAPVTFDQNLAAGKGGAIATSALSIEADADVLFSMNKSIEGGAICISKDMGSNPSSGTSSSLSLVARGGNIVFSDNTLAVASSTHNAMILEHDTAIQQIVAYGTSKIIFHDPIIQKGSTGTTVYTLSGAPHATDPIITYNLLPSDSASSFDLQPSADDVENLHQDATSLQKAVSNQVSLEERPLEATNFTSPAPSPRAGIATIPTVNFNQVLTSSTGGSSEAPSGYVIFSGHKLSSVETLIFQNYTSVLLANVHLNSGYLVLSDNARLRTLGLTISGTGLLVLGSGGGVELVRDASAVASSATSSIRNFSVTNIGCEALSFLKPTYSPAILDAGSQTVTLTGTVKLVSEDDVSLYDNPILAKSVAFPFVTLTSSATSNGITMTSFTPGDIATEEHYGFQGQWFSSTVRPLQKPSPSGGIPPAIANTVYMAWDATSPNYITYLLDPARRGELVPNSLWSSFSAMRTFSESLEETITNEREGVTLSIKGLGTISTCNTHDRREGFSEKLGGYQATASIQYLDNTLLGVSFGQLYGRIKSRPYDYKNTEHVTLASILGRFPILTRCSETRLTWEACYAYTANSMKTDYTTLKTSRLRRSKGLWHNNSYYAQLFAEYPFLEQIDFLRCFVDRYNVVGFIGSEFIGGWQQSFTETGDLIRRFKRGKGYVITTPVGLRSEWYSKIGCSPVYLTLRAVFRPDVVRVVPHTDMTIVESKVTNAIHGASLARYAGSLGCNGRVMLTRNASWSFDYLADVRKGASSQRLSTGLQRSF